MKKVFFVLAIVSMIPFISSASYKIRGAAKLTGVSNGVVSFECPPPYVTCFTHSGNATSPGAGQHIQLHIGPNIYDMTLISASAPIPTGQPNEFKEGTYVGTLD